MLILANFFRVANVLLCMAYMPLLYLRLRYSTVESNRPYLLGVFALFVGIILGAYYRRYDTFIPALPAVTLGLLIMFGSSLRNQIADRRKSLKRRGSVPHGAK
jgi:XapX domain-containing protein